MDKDIFIILPYKKVINKSSAVSIYVQDFKYSITKRIQIISSDDFLIQNYLETKHINNFVKNIKITIFDYRNS